MKIVRLWLPLCLAGMLLGCGQKGPLVLPDAPKHKKAAPRPPAAPAPSPPSTAEPAAQPPPANPQPPPADPSKP